MSGTPWSSEPCCSPSPPSSSQGPRGHEVIAVVPTRPRSRRHCPRPADSPLPTGAQRELRPSCICSPAPRAGEAQGEAETSSPGMDAGSKRGEGGAHESRAWLPRGRQGGQQLEGLGLSLNPAPQPCPRLPSHVTRWWPHVEGDDTQASALGCLPWAGFEVQSPLGAVGLWVQCGVSPRSRHRARERLSRHVLGRQGLAWTSTHPFSLCYHRGLLPRVRAEAPGGGPGGARVPGRAPNKHGARVCPVLPRSYGLSKRGRRGCGEQRRLQVVLLLRSLGVPRAVVSLRDPQLSFGASDPIAQESRCCWEAGCRWASIRVSWLQ